MAREIRTALEKGCLVIAHRGARSVAPENSLAAARKALAAGAQLWEIDVRMCRSGELVVVHDSTLDRVSDVGSRFPDRGPWYVHDFTMKELKSLDSGSWFSLADPFGQVAAGVVDAEDLARFRAERLATLEEAIRFTLENDWLVNIEIKDLSGLPGDGQIVGKVVDLVRSLGAVEKVLISSFNHDYLARARRIDHNIATGVLVDRSHRDPVGLMLDLDASTFNPALSAFRPRLVPKLKEKGFGVLVWVVNNEKLARALFRMGVSGIFTDFPQSFSKDRACHKQ